MSGEWDKLTQDVWKRLDAAVERVGFKSGSLEYEVLEWLNATINKTKKVNGVDMDDVRERFPQGQVSEKLFMQCNRALMDTMHNKYNNATSMNSLDAVKNHYDRHWMIYERDGMPKVDWALPWKGYRDPFLACMKKFDYTNKTILEIGSYCGWWYTKEALASELEDVEKIIAVDIIENLDKRIQSNYRIPHQIREKISCYQTDCCDLKTTESNTVDLVFSFDTFQRCSIDILQEYLKEIYRVLKPSGKAVLHMASEEMREPEHDMYASFFVIHTAERLQALIDSCNFSENKTETFNQGLLLHLAK